MLLFKMRFTEILTQNNTISRDKIAEIATKSEETGVPVENLLKSRGISEDDILNAKSKVSNLPVKKIVKGQVPFEVLRKIPEEAARHYKFVPLGVKEDSLEVGMVEPSDIEAREALQFIVSKTNLPLKLFVISESD
ncbi:MAG: hypothetical protein AAB890_01575, partial [Patescibacteria group bacterium]